MERGQYRFLQGLIRDVALARLSRETRRSRHLAVAEHLESQEDPELAGIVAGHYLQALEASPIGESRDAIRDRALLSMAQAASRATDLKSDQQLVSISESALEIADDDEARIPFWEMTIEAAGRLANLESAERYAVLAMAHYHAQGDQVSLTRVTRKFALGLARTTSPNVQSSCFGPLSKVTSPRIRRGPPELPSFYARGLMLNQMPGVVEAATRALAAVEELGFIAGRSSMP